MNATATTESSTTYAVCVMDRTVSSPAKVVIRRCGHEHRSIASAQRCCESLTRRFPDGSIPAKWWGAGVRHVDGSALTEAEFDVLIEVAR